MTLIKQELIDVADHSTMKLHFVTTDPSEQRTGIILFQEIFGVNSHIKDIASRLAHEGYFVVAPDIFHRSEPDFDSDYTSLEKPFQMMMQLTPEGLQADIESTYRWMQTSPYCLPDSIGAVGFCMGGRLAFLANILLPLKASCSFYGVGIPQHLSSVVQLHGPQLLFWAGQDDHIPSTDIGQIITALKENNKNYTNIEYGNTKHGFFCDQRESYHLQSAKQAWSALKEFLSIWLKPCD